MNTVKDKTVYRSDANDKVSGKALYTGDMYTGSMLVGKVLGSKYASARVISIDRSAALAIPGVKAVLSFEDTPKIPFTPCGHPYSFASPEKKNMYLLTNTPKYVGDPVAAVVASDEMTAKRALEALRVEYEVFEPVLTLEEAMAEGAPLVHESCPGNIMASFCEYSLHDDWQKRLDASDFKIHGVYSTQQVQHCHMEPCVSIASMDGSGRITVTSSTQVPFYVRRRAAEALGIPEKRLRIVKPYVGGGFGAKQDMVLEALTAFLTMSVGGRPVMLSYSREECMSSTRTRYGSKFDITLSAGSDGKMRGMDMECIYNGGSYATHNHSIALTGANFCRYPYEYGTYHIKPVTVYTNITTGGAMRAYGAPQMVFAVESSIEDLAVKMKVDPLQFRLDNLQRPDYVEPETGIPVTSNELRQCLCRGAELIDWKRKKEQYPKQYTGNIRRGLGVACLGFACATVPFNVEVSGARLTFNEDGSFILQIGATEIGQGSDTAFAQIAAETLGVDFSDVVVVSNQDTDVSPYDGGAFATRQTYTCGSAIVKAAAELSEKILSYVSRLKCIPLSSMMIKGKNVVLAATEEKVMSLNDVALHSYFDKTKGEVL